MIQNLFDLPPYYPFQSPTYILQTTNITKQSKLHPTPSHNLLSRLPTSHGSAGTRRGVREHYFDAPHGQPPHPRGPATTTHPYKLNQAPYNPHRTL